MRLRLTSCAIALVLPVGAMAQSITDCPGGDLTDCIVNPNPPALQDLRDGELDMDAGEATRATDGTGPSVEVGGTLSGDATRMEGPAGTGLTDDPNSAYFDTGSSYVRTDAASGEVLEVREYGGGTGVRRGGSNVSGGAMQANDLGGTGISRGNNVTRGASGARAPGAGSPDSAPDSPLAETGADDLGGAATDELDEGPTQRLDGSGTTGGLGDGPGTQDDPALGGDVGTDAGRDLDVDSDPDHGAGTGRGVDTDVESGAGIDGGVEAGTDAGAAPDAETGAGDDTGTGDGLDADTRAGTDAGADSGLSTGTDGGSGGVGGGSGGLSQ